LTFGHIELFGLIGHIKEKHPEIAVAVGGPYISTLRENALGECKGIDYGIMLEGDRSFVELCEGKNPEEIEGIIYRADDLVIKNDFKKFIMNLNDLPFPKYEAFELESYPSKQIGIVTSRGCPYSCIYCPVIAAIGQQFRQRSAEGVVEEIAYWYDRDYRKILIFDDNFTLDRARTEKICDLLSKRNFTGISLKLPNGIRADKVDLGLLKKMREAGFDMIAFGVESAEDRILKNIKKGEDAATIEKSISDACKLGFDVDLFFIIGSPGETFKDFESSLSLAVRYPVKYASFYNLIPFPSTELFEWVKNNNYFLYPPEKILNNASHYVNTPCFCTPEMSARERRKAFKIGQAVSRKIYKRHIERKLKMPFIFKRILSLIYTFPPIENIVDNARILIRIREKIIKIFGKNR